MAVCAPVLSAIMPDSHPFVPGHLSMVHGILDTESQSHAGRYSEVLDRIFNVWDFDRILPCHGNLVKSGGKARLRHDLSMKD